MDKQNVNLLTAAEVGKILRIRQHTVYIWAKQGIIPSIKLGRLTRFRASDFCDFEWASRLKNL